MVYIKFSNGPVTKLINMNNINAQNDAIEDGFYIIMDDNNVPEVVESSTLVTDQNLDRAEMLKAISEKLAGRSKTNRNTKTLYGKNK